jgi:hypothetical protein
VWQHRDRSPGKMDKCASQRPQKTPVQNLKELLPSPECLLYTRHSRACTVNRPVSWERRIILTAVSRPRGSARSCGWPQVTQLDSGGTGWEAGPVQSENRMSPGLEESEELQELWGQGALGRHSAPLCPFPGGLVAGDNQGDPQKPAMVGAAPPLMRREFRSSDLGRGHCPAGPASRPFQASCPG